MNDERPCNDCRDWRTCSLNEAERLWFGYRHLRFCPAQIFWLLRHENMIRGGKWPAPDYADPMGTSSTGLPEGAFVKASTALAEIYARLAKTGDKGDILAAQCKEMERERWEWLGDKAKAALFYVSGRDRKQTPFSVWQAKRRYRNYTPRKDRTLAVKGLTRVSNRDKL